MLLTNLFTELTIHSCNNYDTCTKWIVEMTIPFLEYILYILTYSMYREPTKHSLVWGKEKVEDEVLAQSSCSTIPTLNYTYQRNKEN